MARRKKINVSKAIKRPGALTRAKKKGESTNAAARRLQKGGTPLQKRQASFYLNILSGGRKKGKSTTRKRSTSRKKK